MLNLAVIITKPALPSIPPRYFSLPLTVHVKAGWKCSHTSDSEQWLSQTPIVKLF